jgi:hypothetical protein
MCGPAGFRSPGSNAQTFGWLELDPVSAHAALYGQGDDGDLAGHAEEKAIMKKSNPKHQMTNKFQYRMFKKPFEY